MSSECSRPTSASRTGMSAAAVHSAARVRVVSASRWWARMASRSMSGGGMCGVYGQGASSFGSGTGGRVVAKAGRGHRVVSFAG